MDYKVIATGSTGNATIIGNVLVDCGVPYKRIEPYLATIKVIFLTHSHTDHINISTIKAIALTKPLIRFACGNWLLDILHKQCKIPKRRIDVLAMDKLYRYKSFSVKAFHLLHNVPNCGFHFTFKDNYKVLYATDCSNISHVEAKGYDLYMVEGNYEEEELQQRIKSKQAMGEYPYEIEVSHNHLSVEQALDFIYSNMNNNSQYVIMHQHKSKQLKE